MKKLLVSVLIAGIACAAAGQTNTNIIVRYHPVLVDSNGVVVLPDLDAFRESNDLAKASSSVQTNADAATNYFWRNGGILQGQFGIATTDMVVSATNASPIFFWPTNTAIDMANSFFTNGTAGGDLNTADVTYFYNPLSDSWKIYYLYSPNRMWLDTDTQTFMTNLWLLPGQIFYYRNRSTNDLHWPVRAWFSGNYITEQWMAGMFLKLMYTLDRREGGRMLTHINFNGFAPVNLPWSNTPVWVHSSYAPTASTDPASNYTMAVGSTNLFVCFTNNWRGVGTNWARIPLNDF
ncbi:MAG: hypothetical protein V1929_00345 [bacterium]